MENRRILVFTGNGKGKTTAALGMALRASGHGMRVKIIQFIKADDSTGELAAVANLPGVELVLTGCGFVPSEASPTFAKHREAAEKGLKVAADALGSGDYGLVVLDEICTAVAWGLCAGDAVVDLVKGAASCPCVVLTGRGATPSMIELADTVTDMTSIKHGMEAGLPAQRGVEF